MLYAIYPSQQAAAAVELAMRAAMGFPPGAGGVTMRWAVPRIIAIGAFAGRWAFLIPAELPDGVTLGNHDEAEYQYGWWTGEGV